MDDSNTDAAAQSDPNGLQKVKHRQSERPLNYSDLRKLINDRRASLSPMSDGAYERFVTTDERCLSEDDVKTQVMPIVFGSTSYATSTNMLYNNLAPITEEQHPPVSAPKPDYYDGVRPADLLQNPRRTLAPFIQPSKTSAPILPNYACEIKGPEGSPQVLQRQACHDGAVGARAMHHIQSYKLPAPDWHGKACSLTSTYQKGTASVYAHHVTPPAVEGGRERYHMTRLGGAYALDSVEGLKRTCTLLRNARDYAAEERAQAVRTANARELDNVAEYKRVAPYALASSSRHLSSASKRRAARQLQREHVAEDSEEGDGTDGDEVSD